MNKIKRITTALILFLIVGCQQKEMVFDVVKWNKKTDLVYPYREVIAEDLIENHLKKGMSYQQLTDLIGRSEMIIDSTANTIGYTLKVDYGWDIDPVETKTLIIELTADSLVQDYKIEHWNNYPPSDSHHHHLSLE